VKPDGVSRGLIGEIISRFEKTGLKLVALKMVWPTKEHIERHYPSHNVWFESVGTRTSGFFKEHNIDPKENFGTDNPVEIGKQVKSWMSNYMTQGPVVAMVIQGMHAIKVVRKMTGHTYPVEALPGTVRGDFSVDTPTAANTEKRVVKNIIHASGSISDAEKEVPLWFEDREIFKYRLFQEAVLFSSQGHPSHRT